MASDFRDQHLAAQRLGSGLRQDLPGHGGVALAHLREHRPEVRTGAAGLNGRIRHFQLRALVARGLGLVEPLAGLHFSSQAILGGLNGIRTFGAVEVRDVVGQQVRVGQQQVVRRVVFSSGPDHVMSVGQLLLDALQLLHGLSGVLRLGQQGILDHAGVAVQQGRGLSTEVLQDLKTFVADACQILVGAALALDLRLAEDRSRYRGRGVGLSLWEC